MRNLLYIAATPATFQTGAAQLCLVLECPHSTQLLWCACSHKESWFCMQAAERFADAEEYGEAQQILHVVVELERNQNNAEVEHIA